MEPQSNQHHTRLNTGDIRTGYEDLQSPGPTVTVTVDDHCL